MSLERIRQQRRAELQARLQHQGQDEQEFEQQLAQLEAIVRMHMTKDAISRLGNVKAARPERAVHAIAAMAQLIQTGRVQTIDDATLRQILARLEPEKKPFTLKRV